MVEMGVLIRIVPFSLISMKCQTTTFVFSALFFNFSEDFETVIHSNDAIAPVGYLNFRKLRLVDKEVGVSGFLFGSNKKNTI